VVRLSLRLVVQLPLQAPELFRWFQVHRQSPLLAGRQSAPEVRTLPSTGITRLPRCNDPARLPDRPAAQRPLAPFRHRAGSPTLPETPFQRPAPTPPADWPGARVDRSPDHAAFPVSPAGRHPQLHFRGLLKVYTHYGPLNCSTAQGGLCREASNAPVAQGIRSPATRSIDSYPDGSFFHWCFTPSWRTERVGVRGSRSTTNRHWRSALPVAAPLTPALSPLRGARGHKQWERGPSWTYAITLLDGGGSEWGWAAGLHRDGAPAIASLSHGGKR